MYRYTIVVRESEQTAEDKSVPKVMAWNDSIEADYMTIETCGALSFWLKVNSQQSRLIQAYAIGQWLRVTFEGLSETAEPEVKT